MKHRAILLICGYVAASLYAWADIAPTRFTGSGIVPDDEPDVRMESADVTIRWGHPSSLAAEFVLINESGGKTLTLGFPVGAYVTDEAAHIRR